MANDNDTQADALVAALAPKIMEAIIPKITEGVETQIKGIKDKNQELLDKLAKTKHDDMMSASERLLAAADNQLNAYLSNDGLFVGRKAGDNIKITRSDARDVRTYREAKALAAKQGVALEIVANE